MNRMWHLGVGQPKVQLLDANKVSVGEFNLDVPKPDASVNIAAMMAYGHTPERTPTVYGDGTKRDEPHGYRFRAHLYYTMTNATGRALCVAVVSHLMNNRRNTVKFWPHRDVVNNWHICKLDEDPDVDALIEYRAIGYSLTLSLEGVRREYVLPTTVIGCITNFNEVGAAYAVGDHVKNFASVAAVYGPDDQPAYFCSRPSKGEADLPDYS